MNNIEPGCMNKRRGSRPAARLWGVLLTVSLCLSAGAPWPMIGRAQSFTSTGTITPGASVSSPYPSVVSVSGLVGTLTAISLTFTNFSVSNANSLSIVLQAPDGTHNLDLLSGVANVTNGSTFTLSDSGTHGLVPALTGQTPIALSGSYKATDYFPAQDNFPSPGPGTTYTSAGNGASGTGTGTFLNTFVTIPTASLNGTWKLYGAGQIPPPPSGTIASWTLTFSVSNAPATTTTLDSPSPNPAFTSGANSLVTLTAHVNKADLSGPATNGSVIFHDNTLNRDIATNAVNVSGIATATYTFTNEGIFTLLATFTGGTGFAPSLPSATVTETVNNYTTITAGTNYSNPGPITIPGNAPPGTGAILYPSLIYVGTNGSAALIGIIQKLTITLSNLSNVDPEHLGFMLVAPNGRAYEFMSSAGGTGSGLPVTLTFSDTGATLLPEMTTPASGTYLPTSLFCYTLFPESYPLPAPQQFDVAGPCGTATLATEYGGLEANGTWQLFLANRFSDTATGTLSGWSLSFTIEPPDLAISCSHIGGFCQGQTGQYTVIVRDVGGGRTGGDVAAMVIDTFPAGLTPTAASGVTWNCFITNQTVTCIQTNPTASGSSYPPIALTVQVATNAAISLTNIATVSGSGDIITNDNTASDPTVISPTPDSTITPVPSVVCPGSSGNQASIPAGAATCAWTITNGSITSPTNFLTITYTAGAPGNVGLTVQVRNGFGCMATNSLNVPILVDTIPPTITCSTNITVTAYGHCPVVVNFNVSASDNCTLSSLIATPASGSAFPVGTNTVSVVAADAAGNTNNCSFKVTVLPGPAPQLAASLAGTNVVLSWPESAGCYTLQSTPTLSSNLWTNYTGSRGTNAGSILVTNSPVAASRFYRLAY